MNYSEASFGVSENRLSTFSPLHKWRGEALRRGEAKAGIKLMVFQRIVG
jgi:hypothetical protein